MGKDAWDSYFIENTNVLKNKFNISDKKELELKEQSIVLRKLTFLQLDPIKGNCDLEHLKSIHSFIFDEIYDFAGKTRTCTLSKNLYDFCNPEDIVQEMDNTIQSFKSKIPLVKSKDEYAFVLAPFYYDLIRIHPFREGNGRAIREFVREVVEYTDELPFSVELDYTKIDPNNLLLGTKDRYYYPSLLETEFMKALVPKDKDKGVRGK